MKKNWLSIVLIVAAVALAGFSWRCLPDVVTVQVGLDGRATNTLPKMAAIVIPLGLSLGGSLMSLTAKEGQNNRGMVLALAGLAVMALSLLLNH